MLAFYFCMLILKAAVKLQARLPLHSLQEADTTMGTHTDFLFQVLPCGESSQKLTCGVQTLPLSCCSSSWGSCSARRAARLGVSNAARAWRAAVQAGVARRPPTTPASRPRALAANMAWWLRAACNMSRCMEGVFMTLCT